MAEAQPQCQLMNLPLDVHQMIVKSLDLPDILFPPAYGQERLHDIPLGENYFDSQHAKYYGTDRNITDHPGAYALLSWSSTCRFYRQLLKARLLRNVVLRTRLKSIESLETIAQTSSWRDVKSLIVCNTLAELSEGQIDVYRERSRDIEYEEDDVLSYWPEFPLSRLSALLSNLPPNLEALTLDFPWHWIDHKMDSDMEFSATGDFGRMILVILRSICQNNLAAKASFTLRLVNLPKGSTDCTPDESYGLNGLLNCVTNCQISLAQWDNGAGWEQNKVMNMEDFTKSLGPTYIQHLTKVETLELQANDSCPIGLAPGGGHLDFPELSESLRFHRLRNLTLDHFFIDDPLMALVTSQSPNLEHLTLLSCGASGSCSMSEVADPPKWADFFTRLNRGATNLRSLSLRHTYPDSRLLGVYTRGDKPTADIESAYIALEYQDSKQHITSERDWARRKHILPHHVLDDKYGLFFDDEDENAARFLQGEDHRALLELWDAMESRGGEGVIYLPQPPDASSNEPRDGAAGD